MNEMSLYEAMYTQRAIRHFSTQPVPDEAIQTILSAAVRAPSGGNRQPWHFIIVRDRETKRRLGDWYLDAWRSSVDEATRQQQAYRSGGELGRGMADVPVLILVCADQGAAVRGPVSITQGSSIYPAIQNLLLAARSLGLGTVLTTLHTLHETEIKEFLGIPENVDTAALIPLGYPAQGQRFGKGRRDPVEQVTFYDRWGNSDSMS